MTRVLVLLVLFIGAGGTAAALKWDQWFGDEDPVRSNDGVSASDSTSIAEVRHEMIPVHLILGRDRPGPKANITKAVADALVTLAIEGQVDLSKLTMLSRQKKVNIDVLTALPGADTFDVKTIEAFGETGAVDKAELATIARDRHVPIAAIKELGRQGKIPSKFCGPFEVLSEAGPLPMDEFHVVGDQLLVETDVLLSGTRQIKAIEITDAHNEKIRIERATNGGAWVVPSRFGAKVTPQRMKMVCRALDGLGDSDRRGSTPARHKVYEVAGDEGPRIRLEDEQGQTVVDIRVGKTDGAAPGQNPRAPKATGTFVRKVGTDVVFRHARPLASVLTTNHRAWVNLRFFDIPYEVANEMVEEAETIILEFDDIQMGPTAPGQPEVEYTGKRLRYVLACEKKKKEKADPAAGPVPSVPGEKDYERIWKFTEPASEAARENHTMMVDSVTRMILNGSREDIVGTDPDDPRYGFDKPVAIVTVKFRDGTTHTLKIGNQVPIEGEVPEHQVRSRYAIMSGDPFVAQLSEYTIRSMLKRPDSLKDPNKREPGARSLDPNTQRVPRPRILAPDERDDETKKPGGDAKKPGDDAKKPGDDAKKPGDDAKKPGDDAKKPGDASKPGGGN